MLNIVFFLVRFQIYINYSTTFILPCQVVLVVNLWFRANWKWNTSFIFYFLLINFAKIFKSTLKSDKNLYGVFPYGPFLYWWAIYYIIPSNVAKQMGHRTVMLRPLFATRRRNWLTLILDGRTMATPTIFLKCLAHSTLIWNVKDRTWKEMRYQPIKCHFKDR